MSDIIFNFIGWQKDDEHNHDKIWTSFEVDGQYYCAWGRRGKKLAFKHHTKYSVQPIERKKRNSYEEVDNFILFTIFPTFTNDVESMLFMATLSGKVK